MGVNIPPPLVDVVRDNNVNAYAVVIKTLDNKETWVVLFDDGDIEVHSNQENVLIAGT